MAIPEPEIQDDKMGGRVMKGRFSMKMESSTFYTYKYEMAGDDGNYVTVMEGKANKK